MRSFLAFLLLAVTSVHAGERPSGTAMVNRFLSDGSSVLVNGFGRAIAGEAIDYHSVNELARLALLTRTTDGTMAIEWRTGPVPAAGKEYVTFFWLAALAGSKGVHVFTVDINGKHWFTFSSPADTAQETWTVQHPSGATFSFAALEADRYGDLFGYSFLKLPASLFRTGDSLTLRIVGEAAGSPCWYMTFEHPVAEASHAEFIPALIRDQGSIAQVVKVTLEHYGPPKDVTVSITPARKLVQHLSWGATTLVVPTDTVAQPESRAVQIESGGTVLSRIPVTVKPVRRRELYLLPHSHTDIGYSDHQRVVEQNHMRYLDEAMRIAERSKDYPAGAQFRWNIEVLWPLESYMDRASPEQKQKVVDAVKRGWIGVNGLYANELTGLCRPEELFHLTDYARHMVSAYGITVNSAMITDIPSYTSNIVTALAESGIRYFSSGPNFSPAMPDGGDRIGHALREWGDRPFYWESQSGKSRVLFWMTATGYSWFHGWIMGRLSRSNTAPIFHYLESLDSTQYPYDMVQLRYTIDGDNGPPDPDLPDFVKDWNERYLSPTFHIATVQELFEEFERRYGSELPVWKGDLTPVWEDGAVSTAAEVAGNRHVAETLVEAEVLSSMTDPAHFPAAAFAAAWRNVVLFDEHTWGAWNSVSEPDSPSVIAQWDYKRDMLVQSSSEAAGIMKELVGEEKGSSVRSLDVFNTNSWPRTDVVIIPASTHIAGPRVKDDRGTGLPSQILSGGDLAVLVSDVPALGVKRLMFEKGRPFRPRTTVSATHATLNGDRISVELNPNNGSILHLIDVRGSAGGTELVDGARGNGLNEYIYVPGLDPATAAHDSAVSISVGERGPLVASLVVTSTPPGSRSLRREYRVYPGIPRVDIVNIVDKLKVREKESLHFGFPFMVPEGVPRVDEGLEVIRPEADQLPGANRDYFSVQRWMDVSNSERGVTWATVDAPLVEIGEMTSEKPGPSGYRIWRDTIEPAQNFYSYAMNNYWHTNYKADQEGIATFRYSILPHGPYDRASATRFGTERSQPLLLLPVRSSAKPLASLFEVKPADVIVTTVRPAADGTGWIVHLLNAGDASADVSVAWRRSDHAKIFRSDLFEKRFEEISGAVTLPPSGVLMITAERH